VSVPVSQSASIDIVARPTVLDSLIELDQMVLDALPIGAYACDAEGRIVRFNRKAVELWGRKPSPFDAAQRFCACFRVETLQGTFLPPEATPMAHAVRRGERFEDVEARVENPDGHRWVASVTAQPLRDEYGRIIGAINCFRDITREYEQREALARRQRTFDLAMVASKMGTWRYTMDDNICLYDENAQRLYGLTEARFLHDEEGVKAKFHPDDLERMWSCVTKACDPAGDGRYDVQYRVKQQDGSWRWLSAWGFVEFEGQGPHRRPVAITGASRDISDLVNADEAQKILMDELNHRVKNTLATVQSIAMHTQRSTPEAFGERFDERLMALSRAHDLLSRRNWTGVGLRELLDVGLAPYASEFDSPIVMDGPEVIVAARMGLALGMVIHELATNAAKYGALSSDAGRLHLCWFVVDNKAATTLSLRWIESGEPTVAIPDRKGFGTRLIERSVMKDLGGQVELRFASAGFECELSFPLADSRR
jgi:two-component sensor histidine kinase